jgi:tetratricopeptide (TPR) repeat protein
LSVIAPHQNIAAIRAAMSWLAFQVATTVKASTESVPIIQQNSPGVAGELGPWQRISEVHGGSLMTASRRTTVLMGILLTLLLGFVYKPYWQPLIAGTPARPADAPPLAGKNSISHLSVDQDEAGAWKANFDYFYTGDPKFASFSIELKSQPGASGAQGAFPNAVVGAMAERGQHHASVEIHHPGSEGISREVLVQLKSYSSASAKFTAVVSERIDKTIVWPSWQTWMQDQQFAKSAPDEMLNRAVAMIDSNSTQQASEAKSILERLIGKNPNLDQGYVELARVAMKTNWGPAGLHEAENLLSSALQIRPDSVNAKILLGYVYAHQQKYSKADALFAEAATSNPPNLWLWANWGEVLAMQGKFDQAAVKYREAISRPMTHDTYDRARADAYTHLLALLERKKDLDAMEALYKQRVEEFGPGSCYSADYSRFLLQQRGDAPGAIDLARRALNLNCQDADSRQVLGLAHYVIWAQTSGPQRSEALNQARIYLPPGPMPLYLLATHARTLEAARQLIAAGEQIDQRDNERMTALAYALQHEDLPAAKQLLKLGARPDAPAGYDDMPVALGAVMSGNIDAIRLMQQFGADYAKLRYQGATAFDFAKQTGNSQLQEVLVHQGPML